ncbi:hypothetical protein GCK72_002733 [Caenorhabditis remanei]|uniref:Uncharacterized protein n=1 Tax=Caenorhabditis remanei TaxID=31234 RepID=A0A6A5HT53_CAERE|nr:hypothetical protein GCK72_002733 [Caenorhabditis remanei]KAF1770909.1 hypothetical protein GCK72_002733 [Caenorhabditis remanei]
MKWLRETVEIPEHDRWKRRERERCRLEQDKKEKSTSSRFLVGSDSGRCTCLLFHSNWLISGICNLSGSSLLFGGLSFSGSSGGGVVLWLVDGSGGLTASLKEFNAYESTLHNTVSQLNNSVDIESFLVELFLGSDSELPESLEDSRVSSLSLLKKIITGDWSSLSSKSLLSPGISSPQISLIDFDTFRPICISLSLPFAIIFFIIPSTYLKSVGQLDENITILEESEELVASGGLILSWDGLAISLLWDSGLLDPVDDLEVSLKL